MNVGSVEVGIACMQVHMKNIERAIELDVCLFSAYVACFRCASLFNLVDHYTFPQSLVGYHLRSARIVVGHVADSA